MLRVKKRRRNYINQREKFMILRGSMVTVGAPILFILIWTVNSSAICTDAMIFSGMELIVLV